MTPRLGREPRASTPISNVGFGLSPQGTISKLPPSFQRLPPVASFNDLIRAPQQRRRDREAERPGGLEVDHQLVLGRLFDWEFRGLAALENLLHVCGGGPNRSVKGRSIVKKPTGDDTLP